MANELIYYVSTSSNYAFEYEGTIFQGNIACAVGRSLYDSAQRDVNGALRFTGVAIPQGTSVNMAEVHYYVNSNGDGDGYVRMRTYGIDEDNTANFSSLPFGRTKTSAYNDNDFNGAGEGGYVTIDVGSVVNEIVGRGGWSSGNAMGFVFDDRGSEDDNYLSDEASTDGQSYLAVRLAAAPDFTPGPYEVRFPNKPPKEFYGMKVSQEKHEVGTDEVELMYFTSGKIAMKVHKQALQTTLAAGSVIRHELPYVAPALVFSKSGNNRYLLNKLSSGGYSSGRGFVACNRGYLSVFAGSDVYYYIFIDPLEE